MMEDDYDDDGENMYYDAPQCHKVGGFEPKWLQMMTMMTMGCMMADGAGRWIMRMMPVVMMKDDG